MTFQRFAGSLLSLILLLVVPVVLRAQERPESTAIPMALTDYVAQADDSFDWRVRQRTRLAASDVVLLASRTEGLPGCLIEAGLANLDFTAEELAEIDTYAREADINLWAASAERKGPQR
jgi:hypothetical protein